MPTSDTYGENDFYEINKIDAHVHYYTLNTDFLEYARQSGFRLVSINVDFHDEEWLPLANQQTIAKQLNQSHCNYAFIEGLPVKQPFDKAFVKEMLSAIKLAWQNEAIGVKLWKNMGMKIKYKDHFLMIDHPVLKPVFDDLCQQRFPLLVHSGEPKNCWLPLEEMTVASDKRYYENHPQYHMYFNDDVPCYAKQIAARDQLIKNHPNLLYIGAHLGSSEYSLDAMSQFLDTYPDTFFDLSERICHLQYQSKNNRQEVKDFMIRYQDRLLYGTDMIFTDNKKPEELIKEVNQRWWNQWCFLSQETEQSTWEVEGSFRGLGLPRGVIDKIYFHNAIKAYPRLENRFRL